MIAAVKKGRDNGRATRRRMLAAAADLIAQGGEPSVTISAVAERAGITRRAAYHHFVSREELLDALRGTLNEQLLKSLRGVQDFGEPRDLLVALAEEDSSALRFHVFEMLNHGLGKSQVFKDIRAALRKEQRGGDIKPNVDIDMFAVIATSAAFFAATMAMTLAKSQAERHVIAGRFSRELWRTFRPGSYTTTATDRAREDEST